MLGTAAGRGGTVKRFWATTTKLSCQSRIDTTMVWVRREPQWRPHGWGGVWDWQPEPDLLVDQAKPERIAFRFPRVRGEKLKQFTSCSRLFSHALDASPRWPLLGEYRGGRLYCVWEPVEDADV